jgi:hypothetical protein
MPIAGRLSKRGLPCAGGSHLYFDAQCQLFPKCSFLIFLKFDRYKGEAQGPYHSWTQRTEQPLAR